MTAIIKKVNPIIIYPACLKQGKKQDCFNCELQKKNLCSSPRSMCVKCYKGHPKGCPNYNMRKDCPPNELMLDQVFDMDKDFYVIITTFVLKDHINKMKEKHPGWSESMLRNSRYWQGTNRKEHKQDIKEFNLLYPNFSVTKSLEAMGTDVIATLKQIGIELKFPVEELVYRVSLAGILLDSAHEYYVEEIGTYGERVLKRK